jgi:hypothetical protein
MTGPWKNNVDGCVEMSSSTASLTQTMCTMDRVVAGWEPASEWHYAEWTNSNAAAGAYCQSSYICTERYRVNREMRATSEQWCGSGCCQILNISRIGGSGSDSGHLNVLNESVLNCSKGTFLKTYKLKQYIYTIYYLGERGYEFSSVYCVWSEQWLVHLS